MSGCSRTKLGCAACRKRRVKCDQVQPRCDGCFRLGLQCEYRQIFDGLHRDQNTYARAKAQKGWRQRVAGGGDSRASIQLPAGAGRAQVQRDGQNILHVASLRKGQDQVARFITGSPKLAPPADWQDLAFMRFRFDFLDPPTAMYAMEGALDLVPRLYHSPTQTNVLTPCLMAASFANYAARTRTERFSNVAQVYYLRALKNLRSTLPRLQNADDSTETLLSAHMLSLYEIVSKPVIDFSYREHLLGVESIMEQIGQGPLGSVWTPMSFAKSGIGILLLKHALLRHLCFWTPLPSWLKDMILMIPHERLDMSLLVLTCDTVDLCAKLKGRQASIPEGRDEHVNPNDLLRQGKALSVHLLAWRKQMPDDFTPDLFKIRARERKVAWVRDLFSAQGAPQDMTIARSLWRSHEVNIYHVTLLNLQCAMLDLVEAMEAHGWSQSVAKAFPAIISMSSQETCSTTRLVHEFTPNDIEKAVHTCLAVSRVFLQNVPQVLGVQPPSRATIATTTSTTTTPTVTSIPSTGIKGAEHADNPDLDPSCDPERPDDLSGFRGYHLFWPLFNLLKSFTRPALRQAEQTGMEAWVKHLLRFLWLELGIAQAEGFRQWYEQGLPAGW